MRQLRHPLSGSVYEVEDALVRVTRQNGQSGLFNPDGTWVSGDKFSPDPHVCLWVGGPQLPSRHQVAMQSKETGEDLFVPTSGYVASSGGKQ